MSAARLIEGVEDILAKIYRFPLHTSAVPFIMKREQLISSSTDAVPPRAAVFLCQKKSEMEIGIYIEPELFEILHNNDPHAELTQVNLDAYCVLVEELSHFHLLLQRLHCDRGVSQLELEWQGEVDKLLVAGLVMSEQRQVSCFRDLHHSIFVQASLSSSDSVYQEASHYAAKCWHRLLPKCGHLPHISKQILPILQSAYHSNWDQKIRIIQSL